MDEQMQDPAYLRALDSIAETMDKCKCSLSENQRVILAGALAVWIPEAEAPSQPAAADEVKAELLEALKYARRMVRPSECNVGFIDAAIKKATK